MIGRQGLQAFRDFACWSSKNESSFHFKQAVMFVAFLTIDPLVTEDLITFRPWDPSRGEGRFSLSVGFNFLSFLKLSFHLCLNNHPVIHLSGYSCTHFCAKVSLPAIRLSHFCGPLWRKFLLGELIALCLTDWYCQQCRWWWGQGVEYSSNHVPEPDVFFEVGLCFIQFGPCFG